MFTDRGTTGRHQDIGTPFLRTMHGGRDVVDAVVHDAKVMHFASVTTGEGGEGKSIRINDLARLGSAPGRHQFIAGAEYGYPRLPVNIQARVIHSCGEHQVAIGKTSSLAQQNLAARKVNSFSAHVAGQSHRLLNDDTTDDFSGEF